MKRAATADDPNMHPRSASSEKPYPDTRTAVPPEVAPEEGSMASTDGSARYLN